MFKLNCSVKSKYLFSLTTLVFLITVVPGTKAFNFDIEKSLDNIFGSGKLDITLSLVSPTDSIKPDVPQTIVLKIKNEGSIEGIYKLNAKIPDGIDSKCGDLEASVEYALLEGDPDKTKVVYKGKIKDFNIVYLDTDDLYKYMILSKEQEHKYFIKITIPTENKDDYKNLECSIDLKSIIWQKNLTDISGYSDQEKETATVKTGEWKTLIKSIVSPTQEDLVETTEAVENNEQIEPAIETEIIVEPEITIENTEEEPVSDIQENPVETTDTFEETGGAP